MQDAGRPAIGQKQLLRHDYETGCDSLTASGQKRVLTKAALSPNANAPPMALDPRHFI
jgi:hypothetical protein